MLQGVASVRQFLLPKLLLTLTDLAETWHRGTFSQAAETSFVCFLFCHQGAVQRGTKGENFGVLAIFKQFYFFEGVEEGP